MEHPDYERAHCVGVVKCYYGAFSSNYLNAQAAQDRLMAEIRTVYPEAKTCYFPVEGVVEVNGGSPVKYKSLNPRWGFTDYASSIIDAHRKTFENKE